MRTLTAANEAQIDAPHAEVVILAKLEFPTPVYVHSRVGNIEFEGNTYTGVGELGGIGEVEESEELSPSPIELTLSGVVPALITEALEAGNYGDEVTIYEGYVGDDGRLIDDPWILGGGTLEFATIELGDPQSVITITVQHDLARLDEKAGDRYTDEDQQEKFSGDTFFSFLHDAVNKKLLLGGRLPVNSQPPGEGGNRGGPGEPRSFIP